MGQAKQRLAEWEAWYATLSDSERIIADASRLLHKRLTRGAGYVRACYFFAFLLRKYLREEKGVSVLPIVGWASNNHALFGHAWAEFSGKRIDLSLTQTSDVRVAPPGDLVILDRIAQPGQISYNYHPETTDEILAILRRDGDDGRRRLAVSEQMRQIAVDDDAIDRYFDQGPPQYRYEAVQALIR